MERYICCSLSELRHFLYLHDSGKRDVVQKFLEKKGTALEIVEAFKKLDTGNRFNVHCLTRALHLVLERIATDHPNESDAAAGACRYFAKSYSNLIEKLLTSWDPSYRKTGLQIITVIAVTTPDMIRSLLGCFNIFDNKEKLYKCLTSDRKENQVSVREVFLRMILSLLVDGTTFVIRVLLEKYELIATALEELVYDDHETVISVVTAFKKCVLESLLISKTKKVHIFDFDNIKALLRLFEWKGPAFLQPRQKLAPRPTVDEEKLHSVRECVLDFLIFLLSSRKYGIAFDAMTHFKQRKNDIQKKTLSIIEDPWEYPQKYLVFAILQACPELAEGMIKHLCYQVSRTMSCKVKAVRLIAEIVTELHPNVMRSALSQISLTHLTQWIKQLCLPLPVLKIVRQKTFLQSIEDPEHRVVAIEVLSALFRQYCNYMTTIIEREKFKGNDLRKFRFDMLDYLFLNFPSVENILLSLFLTIEEPEGFLIDHMDLTFDLLLNICKANRSFVDKTATVMDYIKLLYSFFESTDEEMLAVKLKGMKLLLMLNPKSLLPSQKLYFDILENLSLIFMSDQENTLKVNPILQKLLLNLNIFDNGLLEIDIWLQAMKFVDEDARSDVAKCWKVMRKARDLDMSAYFTIDYTSRSNLKSLFHDIENDVSVQGYMDIPVMSKALVLMLNNIEEYPKCAKYFELVAFFLFHFIPAPRAVLELYSTHYSTFYKYMFSWLDKQKPGKLKSIELRGFNEMYSAVLEGRCDFSESFRGETQFMIDGKVLMLDSILHQESYILILIYEICFVVSQLAEKKNLEEIQVNAASHYLNSFLQILNKPPEKEDSEEIVAIDTPESDETEVTRTEQAVKYIYCRHLPLLQNFNIFGEMASDQNFVKLMCNLTESIANLKLDAFNSLTSNFRAKIVNQIIAAVSETLQNGTIPSSELLVNVLETFQMSDENCLLLLVHLSQLQAEHFILDNHNRSIYFDVLVSVVNRFASLKTVSQNKDFISKIGNIYVKLITKIKTEINLEKLEESFYKFLKISHQCIDLISKEVFLATFENQRIAKSTVKFASLLLERRADLTNEFLSLVPAHLSKKELIYPLLNITILSGASIDQELLDSIYKEYKNGIMKAIEKPQKAAVIYKENVEASIFLIEKCMPTIDFYKKSLKSDSVEIFQLQMIEAIFRKEMQAYIEDVDTQAVIFVNFINCFIQHFQIVMKREQLDPLKVSSICYSIYNWFESYKALELKYDTSAITESQAWQTFCKNCLKFGMRAIEDKEQQISGCNDTTNSLFLKLLAYLFEKLYESNTNQPHVALCFEMITSHSRFFDIVLPSTPSLVKTHLMHLLLVLAQKNHSVMDEKHIPVLLGAYNAKLTICDRYTLGLLQLYEQTGVNCSKYRPFVWGEWAIDQYSLRSQDEKAILQQDLSIAQLMTIVDRATSDFTVENFPIWRNLDTLSQLPSVEFENPNVHWKGYGRSVLERAIEAGKRDFDHIFLKQYPINQNIYDDCYDPAFIIPLMVMSLAPGVYLHPVKPVQNGLLGIAFAALSSFDKDMRLAAGLVHLRYREHFENNKFLDKPLWIQAYDNIQTGLEALQERWAKQKKGEIPRVPYVSGVFLSVAMSTLVNPLDPMYKVLSMYLRVKETFNFLCVPEFNVLFHSPEVDHLTYRQFILNTIRSGIKCSSDLFLLVTTGTFKALMGFYNTTMSTLDINLRILAIINTCVKIPGSVKLMIDYIGVIVWLNSVIDATEYFHFDTIEAIISIISNIWYALKAVEKSRSQLIHVEARLFQLLVKLAPLLSSRLSLSSFTQFLNILAKTANGKHRHITEKWLDHIIGCTQRHYPDHMWCIENMKQFGISCIESDESYCKALKDMELDDMQILGLLSLRNFVVKWKEIDVKVES